MLFPIGTDWMCMRTDAGYSPQCCNNAIIKHTQTSWLQQSAPDSEWSTAVVHIEQWLMWVVRWVMWVVRWGLTWWARKGVKATLASHDSHPGIPIPALLSTHDILTSSPDLTCSFGVLLEVLTAMKVFRSCRFTLHSGPHLTFVSGKDVTSQQNDIEMQSCTAVLTDMAKNACTYGLDTGLCQLWCLLPR